MVPGWNILKPSIEYSLEFCSFLCCRRKAMNVKIRLNAKQQRLSIKLVVWHKINNLDVDAMQESSIQMIQGVSKIPF